MAAIEFIKRGGNEALDINPPAGAKLHITTNGSDWYWTVFSVMGFTVLAYAVAAYFVPRKERVFHYTSIAAAFFASIAYFTLASDLGWTPIETEFSHQQDGGFRQVFYARYIGWFMVSPLLMINVSFLAGMSWITSLFIACIQEIFVISGLIGSLVPSTYKWGYFTIGVSAWFLVAYNLVYVGYQSLGELSATNVHPELKKMYIGLVSCMCLIYSLYPISWGLSEGGNVITPTSEGVFYGVLDIIALPILNTAVLYMSRRLDFEEIGLNIIEKQSREKTIA
ncbi:hypothetical protein V1511DRAFT_462620 [Dipodascopsis uninucleata]